MSKTIPQELLDQAVDAVNAWLDVRWDTVTSGSGEVGPTRQRERLHEAAVKAVTAAVVEGKQVHTLITPRVRCTGLDVAGLISDIDARAEAYRYEINTTENYLNRVRDEMHRDARIQVANGSYGIKTEVAQRFGVRRATLDEWIAKAAESDT